MTRRVTMNSVWVISMVVYSVILEGLVVYHIFLRFGGVHHTDGAARLF